MSKQAEEALRALEDSLKLHLDEYSPPDVALIHRAMHTAVIWQGNRKRRSGTPAWAHSLTVGNDLVALGAPAPVTVAGYHHDDREDLGKTYEDLETLYGREVADLVEALTKTAEETYIAQLVREGHSSWWVLLIKAVDRRHNIGTVNGFDLDKQEEYTAETLVVNAVLRACSIWVPSEWRDRYCGVLDDSQRLAKAALAAVASAHKSTTLTLPLIL